MVFCTIVLLRWILAGSGMTRWAGWSSGWSGGCINLLKRRASTPHPGSHVCAALQYSCVDVCTVRDDGQWRSSPVCAALQYSFVDACTVRDDGQWRSSPEPGGSQQASRPTRLHRAAVYYTAAGTPAISLCPVHCSASQPGLTSLAAATAPQIPNLSLSFLQAPGSSAARHTVPQPGAEPGQHRPGRSGPPHPPAACSPG